MVPNFTHAKNTFNKNNKKESFGKAVYPGVKLIFPRDFGAHYQYGVEWWYVTGWLSNRTGEEFAFQLTFFRRKTFIGESNKSRFTPKHLIFAHATIISEKFGSLKSDQRAGRLGSGLIECSPLDTHIQFEDWFMHRGETADIYRVSVESKEFSFKLQLKPHNKFQNLILRGDNGFSRKGPDIGQASLYYSRPNLITTGELTIDGNIFQTKGFSWLDHEWSSQLLHPDAVGWDWVGVNLIDGGSLMAFRIRRIDGSPIWSEFSMLDSNGKRHPLLTNKKTNDKKIAVEWETLKEWTSPDSFATYPISQKITYGKNTLIFLPLIENQELDARMSTGGFYWEGAVTINVNKNFFGKGFLELTGYSSPLLLG
jgi:predicted secreted hydrolase